MTRARCYFERLSVAEISVTRLLFHPQAGVGLGGCQLNRSVSQVVPLCSAYVQLRWQCLCTRLGARKLCVVATADQTSLKSM